MGTGNFAGYVAHSKALAVAAAVFTAWVTIQSSVTVCSRRDHSICWASRNRLPPSQCHIKFLWHEKSTPAMQFFVKILRPLVLLQIQLWVAFLFYHAVYAMARCLSVQSGVLLKQLNGWNRFSVQNQSKRTSLCNLVPDSELSRFLCFFCHGTSTITGVVNLVRPSRSHLLSFAHWSLAVGSINCNFLRCCCWVVCEHWLYQLMAWCDMSAAIFIFIMKLVNEVCIEVNDKD